MGRDKVLSKFSSVRHLSSIIMFKVQSVTDIYHAMPYITIPYHTIPYHAVYTVVHHAMGVLPSTPCCTFTDLYHTIPCHSTVHCTAVIINVCVTNEPGGKECDDAGAPSQTSTMPHHTIPCQGFSKKKKLVGSLAALQPKVRRRIEQGVAWYGIGRAQRCRVEDGTAPNGTMRPQFWCFPETRK